MSKISEGRSVSGLRKKLMVQAVVAVLVVAAIGVAGLMTTVQPRDEEFDLDRFLETLDLPQRAPYQASGGILDGQNAGERFGWSVANVGDITDNDVDDFAVGAPYYNSAHGNVYLFFDGDFDDVDITITGDSSGDYFGQSVSAAGDFDADGKGDLVIGAPGAGGSGKGMVYVFIGRDIGSWTDFDASNADYSVEGENANDEFGASVSSVDSNGDDYGDVLVGAYGSSTNTGKVYLYEGNDNQFTDAEYTWTGSGTGYYFGISVSSAGNIDDDGDDTEDVIIGAHRPSYSGEAYIYFGDTSDMSNTPDVTITGEGASNRFGQSVSDAGNVNNDDYDDVIIGDEGAGSYGKAYIFTGRASWDQTYGASDANVILVGETDPANAGFGESVSSAGDYNADSYDDVIVGSKYESALGGGDFDETGRAHIFYGGSTMDTKVDVSMTGEGDDDYFGHSVSNAGDINDDGYDEVIVGAPDNDDPGNNAGRAYVYNFVDHMEDMTLGLLGYSVSEVGPFNDEDSLPEIVVGDPVYQVSSAEWGRAYLYEGDGDMDPNADYTFSSEQIDSKFGYSVASGDFDNDGYGDVVVGAPGYDDGGTSDVGRVYIYLGDDDPDETADIVITGDNEDDQLGWSVASAGHWGGPMGGDVYEDLLIGAPGYSSDAGRAYLFYGRASWNAAYDADEAEVQFEAHIGDGKFGFSVSGAGDMDKTVMNADELLIGAPLFEGGMPYPDIGRVYVYSGDDGNPAVADATFTGENANDQFGFSVSNAGNVNNDIVGHDDIIIGAPKYSSSKGRAYIFLGGHSLSGDTGGGSADEIMTGEATGDEFGYSVSDAGNVNNDDYDDVVIGAPLNDMGGTDAGRVYIYYGSSTLNNWDDVFITGVYENGAGEKKGWSVSGAGDVNGDDYDDIVIGAPYRMGTISFLIPEGKVEVWGDPEGS